MKLIQVQQIIVYATLIICIQNHACIHDQFAGSINNNKHYLNDLSPHSRSLQQAAQIGRIRIFVDYTQVSIGDKTQINTIRRAVNITASYFYNLLNVTRLSRLYFPKVLQNNTIESNNGSVKCGKLNVPQIYLSGGTIGDIGVICGNQHAVNQRYIAQSTSCAFLQSTKRPIWGMMNWNNIYLRYDQEGFQQIVSIGIHQMTHILGFSASLFDTFPGGNPLIYSEKYDQYYLSSPRIKQQIKNHYNCSIDVSDAIGGLPLEDQDGTLISSHWEKKVVGNEVMIASNSKNMYMSVFTLALFEKTGWYSAVNYSYTEPILWGKNKKCQFLNIDICDFSEQICNDNSFNCDFDGTAIGKCSNDLLTGACKISKHYTNTICVDQNYQLKNLNWPMNAFERGGSHSKCFESNYREEGIRASALNFRCYISVCSYSENFLYVLVGSYLLICRKQGQILPSIPGLQGTLVCPRSFANYCSTKKVCAYHCNKNGACINGMCHCSGQKALTSTCMDISIFEAPIGASGGFLQAVKDTVGNLIVADISQTLTTPGLQRKRAFLYEYSLNLKCIQGSVFDTVFGICLKCSQFYGCENCVDAGCISCDDGRKPQNGIC